MFLDYNVIKLEFCRFNNPQKRKQNKLKTKPGKELQHTQMLLNNPQVKKDIIKEITKYLKLNYEL